MLALAPDAAGAKAGRGLSMPGPWSNTGAARDRALVWGSCETSPGCAAPTPPRRSNCSPGRGRARPAAPYLLGGTLPDGSVVTPKYVGPRRLMEVAVATLATDRALLLLGVPGTAKTWVSEHLAAAICGDSTLLVQGTSGTAEEAIRYGWNYARLLAEARLLPRSCRAR